MRPRDLLRFVVLKSNRFWLFSALNRGVYNLAVEVFVAACRGYPCIKSVYLRHALHGDGFRPGLSDIDLTVVIEPNLSRKTEFSFLHSFWRRARFLSRLFPMIGEIEILNEAHIESWTRFGLEGRNSREWRLLCGVDTVVDVPPPEPARFSFETMTYACWFYVSHMAKGLVQGWQIPYLAVQDMNRLQRKIERCVAALGVEEPSDRSPCPASSDEANDCSAILLRTLKRLEAGLRVIGADTDPVVSQRDEWSPGQRRPMGRKRERTPEADEFEPWKKLIRSVYLDGRGAMFVILRDSAMSTENHRCVEWIRIKMKGTNIRPVILTRGLFAYVIRFLIPGEYAYLIENAELVFGEDLIKEIAPPDDASFLRDLIAYVPIALMFPAGETFVCGSSRDPQFGADLLYVLKRMLGLKLHLECGTPGRLLTEPFAPYYAAYPHQADRIRALKTEASRGSHDRWRWFGLMRDLIDDIHVALSTSESWENIATHSAVPADQAAYKPLRPHPR